MAYDIPGYSFTAIAAADLTGKEGYGIVLDSTSKAALAGAGVAIAGILRYAGKAGEAVTIVKDGIMGLVFGGIVAAGDNLATDANGKFVKAAGSAIVVGKAFEAAAVDTMHKALLGHFAAPKVSFLSIPVIMSKIANGDIVTDYVPGVAGKLKGVKFVVTDPVITAAKLSNLHLEIEAAAVTGGVVALTSAAATPLGKVIAGTAITADNVITATSKISVVAADTVAFVEGQGVLIIEIEE